MKITINEKVYDFGEEYTRVVKSDNGRYFVHNAPADIPDAKAKQMIEGGYVGKTEKGEDGVERIIDGTGIGWKDIPEECLGEYEVR